jgi:hypothetical protein
MREKICSAINSKRLIRFDYDGGIRLVEPFCYGVHKSTHNEILRGYQVGGYSKSGESFGWKIFRAVEISSLVITDDHFSGVRKGYNPNDSAMGIIYCLV